MQNYGELIEPNMNYEELAYTFQPYSTNQEDLLVSPKYLNLRENHIKEMPIKYLNTVLKMKNFDRNQIKVIKQQRRKMKIRDYAEINKIRSVLYDRKINDEMRVLNDLKRDLQSKKENLEAEIRNYQQLLTN